MTTATPKVLTTEERERFHTDGYVSVRRAFDPETAAALRERVWEALARHGIERDRPETWTVEAPTHLQKLKKLPEFQEIATPRTLGAIDDVLGEGQWTVPKEWGAFFVLFPHRRPWEPAPGSWHVDAPYTDPIDPPRGVKVHSMFGDVLPRAGGMHVIAGSHRVIERYFREHPPSPGSRSAQLRKAVMASHPWLVEVGQPGGDPDDRIARFMDCPTHVWDVPVRVVELTAEAGDVILIHPQLLHNRPTNAGTEPRFLLNKDLRVDRFGWGATGPER